MKIIMSIWIILGISIQPGITQTDPSSEYEVKVGDKRTYHYTSFFDSGMSSVKIYESNDESG